MNNPAWYARPNGYIFIRDHLDTTLLPQRGKYLTRESKSPNASELLLPRVRTEILSRCTSYPSFPLRRIIDLRPLRTSFDTLRGGAAQRTFSSVLMESDPLRLARDIHHLPNSISPRPLGIACLQGVRGRAIKHPIACKKKSVRPSTLNGRREQER